MKTRLVARSRRSAGGRGGSCTEKESTAHRSVAVGCPVLFACGGKGERFARQSPNQGFWAARLLLLRNLPVIGLPTKARHRLLPTIAALGDTRPGGHCQDAGSARIDE